jgi:hypothetical protein
VAHLAGLTYEDHRVRDEVRNALLRALRPEDGGVAERRDLGSFAGHAFGVHVAHSGAPTASGAMET